MLKKIESIEKILFLDNNSNYSYFKNMATTLSRFCKKMIYFNRMEIFLKYGKEEMNKRLLLLIEKEKPDFLFTWLTLEEFELNSLLKIKEISPNTKTVAIFGDDSVQFENFSIYYSLFFDYYFTTLKSYVPKYKRFGFKNIFLTSLTDTETFRPTKLPKIYDVTFVGSKKFGDARYEYIKYLKENGINIKISGSGWANFPDFKDIYIDQKENDDIVKIINQSKINLCFSQTGFGTYQMKAKIFETNSCRAFTLCEFAPDYLDYFKKDKEIIFFKTKEELLKKINFYLKNTKKREEIAKNAYKKTIESYSLFKELNVFFNTIKNNSNPSSLPKLKNKAIPLFESDLYLSIEELKNKIKDFEYIYFKTDNSEDLDYREYLQSYSLERTKKSISCCSYYVYSKLLGNYLYFGGDTVFHLLNKEDFNFFLNIEQIMVTKKYLLENIDEFRKAFNTKQIDFIKKDNTAFLQIPLVRIKDIGIKDYETMQKAFSFNFLFKLVSIKYQKKFFSLYPLGLLIEILKGKTFILKSLYLSFKDSDKRKKLASL